MFDSYPAAVQGRLGYLTRQYKVLSGVELIALGMRNCLRHDDNIMIATKKPRTTPGLSSPPPRIRWATLPSASRSPWRARWSGRGHPAYADPHHNAGSQPGAPDAGPIRRAPPRRALAHRKYPCPRGART